MTWGLVPGGNSEGRPPAAEVGTRFGSGGVGGGGGHVGEEAGCDSQAWEKEQL